MTKMIDKELIIPLNKQFLTHVSTNLAAYYLNRSPQTLRVWACYEKGLIKPIHVNSRLAWPINEIKKILRID